MIGPTNKANRAIPMITDEFSIFNLILSSVLENFFLVNGYKAFTKKGFSLIVLLDIFLKS
jgi:hypothetical protein